MDLSLIHPLLAAVTKRTLERLKEQGLLFMAFSGLRTFSEQDDLYAKGRTKPGNIVTQAKGGQSTHNYGLAVDCVPLTDKGHPSWPNPEGPEGHLWYDLEEALHWVLDNYDSPLGINDEEIEWGGRWNWHDYPHIQIRTTLRELRAGRYPYCEDVEWLVKAHTTFLFDTPWMLRRTQYLLRMQSYEVGTVDGIMGESSQKALAAFQDDHGIEVALDPANKINWVLDQETVALLVRLHQDARSQRPTDAEKLRR